MRSARPPRADGSGSAGRFFALAVPGLARPLAAELATDRAVRVEGSGSDGRSDVVLVTTGPDGVAGLVASRLAEDVFVEVGRTLRAEGDRARWTAGRLWRPARVARALAVRQRLGLPVRARATVRVVARVLQERSFRRTDLRREMAAVIGRHHPQWQPADPSDLEIWVVEYQPGKFVAGLRISDARMRQHAGRRVERTGALRPTVAAAMVRLAGGTGGDDLLLDPCCGSGTILAEAAHAGWRTAGVDIDLDAVRAARRNAPAAEVTAGDARDIPFPGGAAAACVSNLPFGRQYHVEGSMDPWLAAVLGECARVTRPGGRVVLLAPSIPRAAVPPELALRERVPIRLLGTRTTIWSYVRRGNKGASESI